MKRLVIAAIVGGLALAGPAHAGGFGHGLVGVNIGNSGAILGVQTGNVSVLNGGVLNGNAVGIGNGSSILSGIGNGNGILSGNGVLSGNGLGLNLFSHNRPGKKRW